MNGGSQGERGEGEKDIESGREGGRKRLAKEDRREGGRGGEERDRGREAWGGRHGQRGEG